MKPKIKKKRKQKIHKYSVAPYKTSTIYFIRLCIALFYIILRSARREHRLLPFALGDKKSNTNQTMWIFLSFFFLLVLPWCKKGAYTHPFMLTQHCCKYLYVSGGTIPKKKKKGWWWFFGMAVIAEESKHGAGADLCRLSLVKQGRANGLEWLDSKVSVVEVRRWRNDGSGVRLNWHTSPLGIKVYQVQVMIFFPFKKVDGVCNEMLVTCM